MKNKLVLSLVLIFLILPMMLGVSLAEEVNPNSDIKLEFVFNNINWGSGQISRSFVLQFNNLDADKDGETIVPVTENLEASKFFDEAEIIFNQLGYPTISKTAGKLEVGLIYDSLTDLYISLGIDGYDFSKSEDEVSKSFFYTTVTSKQKTIFQNISNNKLSLIIELATQQLVTIDEIGFIYNYGTKYNQKLITSDADTITHLFKQSTYIHQFNMTFQELDDDITFIQRAPNSLGWYTVAVVSGLIIVGITVATFIIYKRKKQ